jgi:hypothetical protein
MDLQSVIEGRQVAGSDEISRRVAFPLHVGFLECLIWLNL